MVASSRGILAIGLSLAGLALLVGPSLGQQQDAAVHKTADQATPKPPAPPVPPIIGTVDIEYVFKNYDKVKVTNKEFNAAMLARKQDLMKIMSEAQQEAELMQKFNPGSEDYKKHETRVTELKARHEAGREQAEREFALRQAESMATLYKEIQAMVAMIAQWRKMNYIMKVSNQPITGNDPNSVMGAISSTVVYADPRNDITSDVVHNLNRFYHSAQSPTPKGSNRAAGGAASSGNGARTEGGN
jgi:Skp family chaperone for outer membrane proteins